MTTVVILAHPNMEGSVVNKIFIEELRRDKSEDVIIHDLYKKYPDFNIDIEAEQQLLSTADRVILQAPVYWYNITPLLKKWLDDVYQYGWAFGEGGNNLRGKSFGLVVTAGGTEEKYLGMKDELPSLGACYTGLYLVFKYTGATSTPPFLHFGSTPTSSSKEQAIKAAPNYVNYVLNKN